MPDFTTMDIATLTRNVTGKGVRYLELFLKEYTSIFKEPVNPSCPACLQKYLTNYKNHFKAMANTSHYRLHAKYENIPLEFGSPILVNNANITNEYAQILLQRPGGEGLFAKLPIVNQNGEIVSLPAINNTAPTTTPNMMGEQHDDDLEDYEDFEDTAQL